MPRLPPVGKSQPKAWEVVNGTQQTTRERVIRNETSSSTSCGEDGTHYWETYPRDVPRHGPAAAIPPASKLQFPRAPS